MVLYTFGQYLSSPNTTWEGGRGERRKGGEEGGEEGVGERGRGRGGGERVRGRGGGERGEWGGKEGK